MLSKAYWKLARSLKALGDQNPKFTRQLGPGHIGQILNHCADEMHTDAERIHQNVHADGRLTN